MVEHMSELRQKLDVTELMTRIEAGGPKMALTLAGYAGRRNLERPDSGSLRKEARPVR
jgi:hypothetical protein